MFSSFLSAVGFLEESVIEGALTLAFRDTDDKVVRKMLDDYELCYKEEVVILKCEIDQLQEEVNDLKKQLNTSTTNQDVITFGKDSEHSPHYWNIDRNRTYDEMIKAGYEMTADGFWVSFPSDGETKDEKHRFREEADYAELFRETEEDQKNWKDFWESL